jgi:deoxycytidine triphosphate deaminase
MDASMFFARIIDAVVGRRQHRVAPLKNMATILNDEEIRGLFGKVIINGDPSCVKPNSYVLRVGQTGEFLNSGKEFNLGGKHKGIKVHPGHSVAITSFETLDFRRSTVRSIYPDHDLHAFLSPSTDLSREGIVAPTTQIDAGFEGTINWTITNTSSEVRRFLAQEKLFRITIFKLAPGETPGKPYEGDYQGKKGYVRSERRGAPSGIRESEWADSCVEGGPEALLENLIKSGYPWNLLGQRLQVIDDQFRTITNEYGEIRASIQGINSDLAGLKRELPATIEHILTSHASALNFRWAMSVLGGAGVLAGMILSIIANTKVYNFFKDNSFWVGPLILVISCIGMFFASKRPKHFK